MPRRVVAWHKSACIAVKLGASSLISISVFVMKARIFKSAATFALLCTLWPQTLASADETETLALLVKTIQQNEDPGVRASLLRGVLAGLAGRRNVKPPANWETLNAELSSSASHRDLALQLSQIFGDKEAMEQALATLEDSSTSSALRRKALRSLLMQRSDEASDMLEDLIDEPDLALDAIRGYAAIENPMAPAVLLDRYAEMNADQKRAIVETLATRKRYANALTNAVSEGTIQRDEIPAHVARSLKELLGGKFSRVFGEIQELAADREKSLAKYKALITPEALTKADVSRGRVVYQKTCAACHVLYGEGGKIGPDLTGSNRANLDYILLNSVDPSYDVPEGYKMEQILTVDGRVVNGVLAEEDGSKVVLKTVEQPRLIVSKEDIETRRVSPKSMMPDGQLDAMKPQEVVDLIKYLRTTEQVEMPQ